MGITAIPPSGGGGGPRRVRSAEEIETRSAVLWPFDFLDSRLHYACCAGKRARYIGSSVSVSTVRFVGTLQPEPPPETVSVARWGYPAARGVPLGGRLWCGCWVPVWTKR